MTFKSNAQRKAVMASIADSNGNISFYDLRARSKVKIPESKTETVVRNGVRLLKATHPKNGYELWRIVGKVPK